MIFMFDTASRGCYLPAWTTRKGSHVFQVDKDKDDAGTAACARIQVCRGANDRHPLEGRGTNAKAQRRKDAREIEVMIFASSRLRVFALKRGKQGESTPRRKAGKPGERQRKIYQLLNVEYRNLPVFKHVN